MTAYALAMDAGVANSRKPVAHDENEPMGSTDSFDRQTRRLKLVAVVVLVITVAAVLIIEISELVEGNFRQIDSILCVLAAIAMMAAYIAIFSGFPWSRRVGLLVKGGLALLLAGAAFVMTLRRDGSFSGTGLPRFVWRWTSPRSALPIQITPTAALDLSHTEPTDFPRFLGADGDNCVRGVKLSRDWTANPPKLLWRREVGAGWSGFAIVGNAAVTMEQRGELESTICYDLRSGQPLWAHSNPVHLIEREGGDGPRATPTIFEGRVYTYGGLGTLDCLDGATGRLIWQANVLSDPENEHLRYGQTSSPIIVNDNVVITGGKAGDHGKSPRPALLAFNRHIGTPAWSFVGSQTSYATPTLATIAGLEQLVMVHQDSVVGHDVADGHILWQQAWQGFWPKVASAMVAGDKVYCSSGYGIGSMTLHITPSSAGLQAERIWSSPAMKTELCNVVIRDGYVYGIDDRNLGCQDLATGQRLWKGERYGHGQLLLVGDILLVQTEAGEVVILEASPKSAVELGRLQALSTSRTCWNPPALAGHILIVRNEQEAACYQLP